MELSWGRGHSQTYEPRVRAATLRVSRWRQISASDEKALSPVRAFEGWSWLCAGSEHRVWAGADKACSIWTV